MPKERKWSPSPIGQEKQKRARELKVNGQHVEDISRELNIPLYALCQFFSTDPTYLKHRGHMAKVKGDDLLISIADHAKRALTVLAWCMRVKVDGGGAFIDGEGVARVPVNPKLVEQRRQAAIAIIGLAREVGILRGGQVQELIDTPELEGVEGPLPLPYLSNPAFPEPNGSGEYGARAELESLFKD